MTKNFDKLYESIVNENQIDEGLKELKIKRYFKNEINNLILESIIIYSKERSVSYRTIKNTIDKNNHKLAPFIRYLVLTHNLNPKEQSQVVAKFQYILKLLIDGDAPEYETHLKIRDSKTAKYLSQILD